VAIDDTISMWHETASAVYHARGYRRLLYDLLGYDLTQTPGVGAGGIFKPNAMKVQERSTPNNSVDVLLGGCVVRGSQNANQGVYYVYNDATVNVSMSVGNATNPRKDVIGVQITDVEYGGGSHLAAIACLTGTPAASPAEPTRPANWLDLALVDVPANDTAFTNSQITDRRRMLGAQGGLIICTSTTRPTVNLYKGMMIYETDTNRMLQYQTATTGWTQPWNMPWGVPPGGYLARTSQSTADMDITPTLTANRRYRFAWNVLYFNNTAGTVYPLIQILDFLANRRGEWWIAGQTAGVGNGNWQPYSGEIVFNATGTGSLVWHLHIVNGGQMGGDANMPGQFWCEDIGPAGAPA
jgi:hypothetical protein